MPHRVWGTKEGKRAEALINILKYPFFGGMFASGCFLVVKIFGPPVVKDLGDHAGEGFAEGVARFQRQSVIGRWVD